MVDVRRLIAFDLDGTLVNSRRDLAESANQLLDEVGAAPLSEDAIGRMVGEGARALVERALAAAQVRADAGDLLPRFLKIYDERLLNHTRVYDGIEDVLREAGHQARVVVLTNKPRRPSEEIIAALGLAGLVDRIVGGDGTFPRKPDPASLQALIAETGVTPDRTLMVGDSIVDYQTATSASVRCCLTAYGFGYWTVGPDARPAWVADSPADVVSAITAFASQ